MATTADKKYDLPPAQKKFRTFNRIFLSNIEYDIFMVKYT